jgi:hypothetical protein
MSASSFNSTWPLYDFESLRRSTMSEFTEIYGPWALVTGASAGIGKAIATELAARGVNIIGTSLDDNDHMLQLNVQAPMQLAKVFGKKMARRGRGGILFISSLFAYQSIPWVANYAATKAYILSLGEALHVEMKRHGVDVTVLSPGLTDTAMPARMPINFTRIPLFKQQPQQVARAGINALGRKATVVPGLLNKFYAWENRLLPRSLPVALFGFLIRRAFRKESEMNPVAVQIQGGP